MAYDIHVARTKDWLDAATAPITKNDVDSLLANDAELAWSTTDYLEMVDDGVETRYFAILWRGVPCFFWYRDQIQCSGPDEAQQLKLAQIARLLNACAVGDDGERYEIKRGLFGKEKLVVVA